jgi:hypothetical protein
MTIAFWINDPSVLFNKDYILELWPTNNMSYEQKLNAITRLIILLTILGYILTKSYKIVVVGLLTIAGIFFLFQSNKQKLTKEMLNEGFMVHTNESDSTTNPVTLETVLKSEFKQGNKKNPFSNVLLTEITDDPNRKSAPPSFNVDVDEDITKNVKRAVQRMNPGIDNTNHQLFGDLYENFELTNSNRVFFTTPNSRVQPGDQAALGQFLYNNLKYSGKESTVAGAIARTQHNQRYLLY